MSLHIPQGYIERVGVLVRECTKWVTLYKAAPSAYYTKCLLGYYRNRLRYKKAQDLACSLHHVYSKELHI